MRASPALFFLCIAAPAFAAERDPPPVAVLDSELPGLDRALAGELVAALRERGLHAEPCSAEDVARPEGLIAKGRRILLLPASRSLPGACGEGLRRFLAEGRAVVALGAPFLAEPLAMSGGHWVTRGSWRRLLEETPAGRLLFDFESGDVEGWRRQTNSPDSPASRRLASGPRGRALEVRVDDLRGWDTLAAPRLVDPFPPGHTLTCLWARGSAETRELSLEWRERDGSRWIAVFPVSKEWRRVVLAPGDFRYWQSTAGRGGSGDTFHPENAEALVVGVAWTHTGGRGGRYDYAVGEIATARNPLGELPEFPSAPALENLSPAWRFHDLHQVERLRSSAPWDEKRVDLPLTPALEASGSLRAHHPRPTGKGFEKGRRWRWIPIAEALGTKLAQRDGVASASAGADDDWRGAVASLRLEAPDRSRANLRASFSISAPAWYRRREARELVASTVERLSDPVFLLEAGSRFFTLEPGERALVGARVVNLAPIARGGLTLRLELRARGARDPLARFEESVSVEAGGEWSFSREVLLPAGPPLFDVEATLLSGGRRLDRIAHELAVAAPKPERERRWVSGRGGEFLLDGKPWRVHGVNYMPSTGIALDDQDLFEHWIGAAAYDPEFVQRDLERCRALGLNAVSAFIYHRSLGERNLSDFLRRAEALDLRVNLSLRPGTPMDYRPEDWEEIIRSSGLAERDVIYAYDIAWEPFFGAEEERRRYDPEWRAWVRKRHGSEEAADRAWGVAAPRRGGELTAPGPELLGRDGPHRRLIADYRRFADELVGERYGEAAARIRRIDPRHLVSFRMTVTGDPTFDGAQRMPYDFPGVAGAVDFLAPEGYGRIGGWEAVKPGIFTAAYARAAAPGKPVLWAEAGVSAWSHQAQGCTREGLDFQGEFLGTFSRMVLESRSSGVVWWWYPGGYRANEDSDFGIIEADGTDRPATRAVRELSARLRAASPSPGPREPAEWIELDRDADARGLPAAYERVKGEFWRAWDAGKFPGLRLKRSP